MEHAYVWAILHGCIPVLIMDDVDLAWSSTLNYDEFSIRVPEAKIPRLYEILIAVPKERIASMQKRLREIWPRFAYVNYRHDLKSRLQTLGYKTNLMDGQTALRRDWLGDDAFDTLMQVLYQKASAKL